MKTLIYKIVAFLLLLGICISLLSCNKEQEGNEEPDGADIPNEEENKEDTEEEIPVEMLDLVADDKLIYSIIFSDNATGGNKRAAGIIGNKVKAEGISASVLSVENMTSDIQKKLWIGNIKDLPDTDMTIGSIDIDKIGVNGFIIKQEGDNILVTANNDKALVEAAEYFTENFLNFEGDKVGIPKDLFYFTSNGLYLTSLKFGGVDVSKYSISADAGMEESAGYLGELVLEKCGVALGESAEKKIILTSEGASGSIASASFVDGNLVISAKDAEAMKKAIVCFWYENIAYSTGSFDLAADLSYKINLGKTVFYSDFDVKQSDNECCIDAIIAAHNYANEKGYKVFADYGAEYYISSTGKTAVIKTDVEWGNAKFTIDDSEVTPDKRGNWIFNIVGSYNSYTINNLTSISRDVDNIGIKLPQKSIVTFYDDTVKQYIRYGGNADNGATKCDSVVVDKDGSIDTDAPLMWDFDKFTMIKVLPIDEKLLTVSGGVFTTIANRAPSEYTYYARGITINRSNTLVEGTSHYIIGEGETGAPYNGFININNCAYVTVRSCILTGHKTYQSPTTAMGSYDIGMGNTISVSFVNCMQTNSITDTLYWGISGTNYCKNFIYDSCVLSRFDAHKGVANAAIKNSVLREITSIGYGTFLIEDSAVFSGYLLKLRDDYGSSWEGELIIRNSAVYPAATLKNVSVIWAKNISTHDFGYTCYMPEKVTIEGLMVYTTAAVTIFSDVVPDCKSDSFVADYPYMLTKVVELSGYASNSKKAPTLCPNKYLFKDTEFIIK